MMDHREYNVVALLAAALLFLTPPSCFSFQTSSFYTVTARSTRTKVVMSLSSEHQQLKDDLVALASSTRRGFSASRKDRDKAKKIINELSKLSPAEEPAAAYYATSSEAQARSEDNNVPSLAGKWNLMYTDAPDITSLDGAPLSIQKLGRIGQECNPPFIKNVIEWKRPDWASSLPFSGDEDSRILQKVVTEGTSTPADNPTVDLKLVGLEISGTNTDGSFLSGPAALFQNNPIKLQGPLKGPFGKFDILYLDDDMRITKTYQGFYAVNIRQDKENEWF
ncbi:hypothetical protein ACHAXM_011243 [Skeletonema potamos]|jgi:hypothetical protein